MRIIFTIIATRRKRRKRSGGRGREAESVVRFNAKLGKREHG
jgi:hypothetical protein